MIRKLLVIAILFCSPISNADNYDRASRYLQRAILETKPVKKITKNVEDQVIKTTESLTGLDRDDWVYISWMVPLTTGRFTTESFNDFNMKLYGGILKPDIEYTFTNQEFNSKINYTFNF